MSEPSVEEIVARLEQSWMPDLVRRDLALIIADWRKRGKALAGIAKQLLEDELHPDFHGGDYQAAYEVIIREARAALKGNGEGK